MMKSKEKPRAAPFQGWQSETDDWRIEEVFSGLFNVIDKKTGQVVLSEIQPEKLAMLGPVCEQLRLYVKSLGR
jgi:hypothetical protein